tara:strand:- start:1076 stop:1843 length:768 start_codon:yes stop_codon:yes gene_type:complete
MAEQDATMPIEEIEQLIAEGYSWSEAANAVAGNPFVFDDPVLGFTTNDTGLGPVTYTNVASANAVPILQSEIIDALPTDMDPDAQSILAMEMFLNVDSAYGDISQVFEADGSINQETFLNALQTTLGLAATAGPMGYGTTTKYLNILTGSAGASLEQLNQQFQEEKSKSAGVFPGLVINRVADTGFANVLGRTASKREQQDFAELVLELGDSIKSVEQLGLEAEEFAREVDPQRAEGMGYKNYAQGIMRVLGITG